MTDMIEKMAKAAWTSVHGDWSFISEDGKRALFVEMRAALKALREPTDEMVKAGALTEGMRAVDELIMFASVHGKFIDKTENGTPLHQAWEAMIDAALHSGKEEK